MPELHSVAQWLWQFNLVLSAQLLLVLILRKPLLRWVGPLPTYRLWLLPLLTLPLLWLEQVGQLPQLLNGIPEEARGLVSAYVLPQLPTTPDTTSVASLTAVQEASVPWLALVLGMWALVSLASAILLVASMIRFAGRLENTSQAPTPDILAQLPLDDVFGRELRVRLVDELNSPALFGALHPVLLLPLDFLQRYSPEQQRLILAHEAVHLQRHDNLLNLLLSLLRLIFWWNPLIHLAWRRYRLDQELSCDAHALASSAGAQQLYARALLNTLSESRMDWSRLPALSTWNQVRELKERTLMIRMNPHHNARRGLGALALSACLLLGAVSTVLSLEMLPAEATRVATAPAMPAPTRNAQVAKPAEPAEVLQVQAPLASPAREEFVATNEVQREVAPAAAPVQQVAAAQPEAETPTLAPQTPTQPLAQRSAAPLAAPDALTAPQLPSPAAPLPASAPAPAPEAQTRQEVRPIAIVQPQYPPRGLQRGVEGYVVVEFTVTAIGEVADLRIAEAEPDRLFDKSAIEAASQFRFEPATQDGEAVAVQGVRYRFTYQLVDDGPWVN